MTARSARTGTRPVIVAGALTAAAGVWYLSRIPAHGTYPASLLPGLVVMAIGIGAFLLAAALIALRATNTRGEPVIHPADGTHAARDQVPAPEPAD